MTGWRHALARTRDRIASTLRRAFALDRLSADDREELEDALLRADMAPRLVQELLDGLDGARAGSGEDPAAALRRRLAARLPSAPFSWERPERPFVALVVGVNGSGKTTSCAKLGRLAKSAGRSPLLAAADTFRAAGSDQLGLWAERLGLDAVVGQTGGDAAAVAFDALDAAVARGRDVVIVDTAGRMHTRAPLMQELEKVRRALAKRAPGAPHETWIALDATLGQNALAQARVFHGHTPLTGAILTKLDGSSKAGFVFSVASELGVPIRFVGLGEGADDLAAFDPGAFVEGLLP